MGNTKIVELFSSVLEAIQLRRRRRRTGDEIRGRGVQNSKKLNYVVLVRFLIS